MSMWRQQTSSLKSHSVFACRAAECCCWNARLSVWLVALVLSVPIPWPVICQADGVSTAVPRLTYTPSAIWHHLTSPYRLTSNAQTDTVFVWHLSFYPTREKSGEAIH